MTDLGQPTKMNKVTIALIVVIVVVCIWVFFRAL